MSRVKQGRRRSLGSVIFVGVLMIVILTIARAGNISLTANAQTAAELQSKIDARNDDIEALEKEIQSYQKEIDSLSSQAGTLSSAIKSLELSRKKIEANISLTVDKIAAKNYEIQRLGKQVTAKEGDIDDNKRIIGHSFTEMNQLSSRSLPEIFLGSDSLASALGSLDELGIMEQGIVDKITSLRQDKADLEHNIKATQKARDELAALNKQLSDQKAINISTTAEQNQLLKDTKQSESAYKALLANRKAREAALQQEIQDYESQLHILINPSSIPHTGKGVLSWPLDKVYVTQYFGNTAFATANPQIYNGKGHTGVDFRASIGTPIKASLSGTVTGVANTDLYPGCYSYGKWIMIEHSNGLSTLYAHLSLQSVSVGDDVKAGQIIGYSGNTGYSTGPHLHFGVYATAGVEIKTFSNSKNCKGATIPIADFSAYLNPLSYL